MARAPTKKKPAKKKAAPKRKVAPKVEPKAAAAPERDMPVISTSQAAKLLMCTEAWIGKLHKMEYFPKRGRGKWNLVEVVQGHIRFLRDEDRRSSKSAGASRIQEMRAERMQMEIDITRRALVPLEDVQVVLDSAASLMRSSIMSVPARFTRDRTEKARLDKMLAETMNSIASGMDKKAANIEAGEPLD